MTRRRLALAIVTLAVVAAACGDSTDVREFEFAEEPAEVIVETVEGNVSVTANSRSGTTVDATLTYGSVRPEVTAELSGGRLVVGDDCSADCRVDYVIRVGDTANVTVDVGTGDVSVSELVGLLTISTGTGDVNLNTTDGPIRVEVGTGDVLGARLKAATAEVRTGEGSIDVTFDNIVDALTVDSGSGDVTAQVPNALYRVEATTEDGSVDIQVDEDPGAGPGITIGTGAGDVTIYKK